MTEELEFGYLLERRACRQLYGPAAPFQRGMNCFGVERRQRLAKQKSESKKSGISAKGPRAEKTGKALRANVAHAIAQLFEHPLVTELVAAEALAAVTSIADHRLAQKGEERSKKDGKVINAASRAAAAAIGARLVTEIGALKPKTERGKGSQTLT